MSERPDVVHLLAPGESHLTICGEVWDGKASSAKVPCAPCNAGASTA